LIVLWAPYLLWPASVWAPYLLWPASVQCIVCLFPMSNKRRWNNIFKSLFLYFVIELSKLFNNIMLKPHLFLGGILYMNLTFLSKFYLKLTVCWNPKWWLVLLQWFSMYCFIVVFYGRNKNSYANNWKLFKNLYTFFCIIKLHNVNSTITVIYNIQK
jgi:hypothetical protein